MVRTLKRLLIINDEADFLRLVSGTAERLGFATRILRHTLDFEYVIRHWPPDCIAVQMDMPDHQDINVLEFLERSGFSGSVLLTGSVPEKALHKTADVARFHGLKVTSVLAIPTNGAELESAVKLLINLDRAA
jgi:CheY-like chemotaxis protein